MPSSAELLPIFEAIAAWEGPELTPVAAAYSGDPSTVLTGYAVFPTEDDFNAGVKYPYTCHGCDTSKFSLVSVSQTPVAEDNEVHTIWTALIFAKEGDPAVAVAERDAMWRNAYWKGFVKHLKLTDKNVTFYPTMEITPMGYDLFGRPEIGIKCTVTIMTRITLPTGN